MCIGNVANVNIFYLLIHQVYSAIDRYQRKKKKEFVLQKLRERKLKNKCKKTNALENDSRKQSILLNILHSPI